MGKDKDDKKKKKLKEDKKHKRKKSKDETSKKKHHHKSESKKKDKKKGKGTKKKREFDPSVMEKLKTKVAKLLRKEYEDWLESDEETANIEWISLSEEDFQIILQFGSDEALRFSATYPESYPNGEETFFIFGDNDELDAWTDAMQEVCDRRLKFAEVLTECAEHFLAIGVGGADDMSMGSDEIEYDLGDDGYDLDDDIGFGSDDSAAKPKVFDAVEEEFANKKFLEIGSPTASLRLIKDLKNIKRGGKDLGFMAYPKKSSNQLENLYHWEVRLAGFDGELGKDLERNKRQNRVDYIQLEMRFSKDYPFSPPFVRVVQPRFKFMTGHVTVGGSICMELLTNSGWRSTNDIESILIQIRAEMSGGGARLDLGSTAQYTESEAWSAFYRAAGNHGWDVKGLNANMFPKV